MFALAFRLNKTPQEIRLMPWRDFCVCIHLMNEAAESGKD